MLHNLSLYHKVLLLMLIVPKLNFNTFIDNERGLCLADRKQANKI